MALTKEVKEKLDIPDLVTGGKSTKDVTDDILQPTEAFPTSLWWKVFSIAATITVIDVIVIGYLFYEGLYILGSTIRYLGDFS
jgi:hypothetical protein